MSGHWHITHRNPDVIDDIGGFGQGVPIGDLGPLRFVPETDLIKGYPNDNDSKNCVEVVLWWAAFEGGFGLERVDDVADDDLSDVENENRESKSLSRGSDTYRQERTIL